MTVGVCVPEVHSPDLLYAGLGEVHQLFKILYLKHQLPGSWNHMTTMQFLQQVQVLLTLIHIVSSAPLFLCFKTIFSVPFVDAPRPATESLASGNTLQVSTHSHSRVNSRYLRELSLGKFIIKYENLTQLDNIGQGIYTAICYMCVLCVCVCVCVCVCDISALSKLKS